MTGLQRERQQEDEAELAHADDQQRGRAERERAHAGELGVEDDRAVTADPRPLDGQEGGEQHGGEGGGDRRRGDPALGKARPSSSTSRFASTQPYVPAWTTANVSAVSAAETSAVPAMSGRRACACPAIAGTYRRTPAYASGPMTRLIQKAKRQSAISATIAPSSGPSAQAAANVAPYSANAMPRAGPDQLALIVASAEVMTTPPATPCTTRATRSTAPVGAAAASTLPARNTARPPR